MHGFQLKTRCCEPGKKQKIMAGKPVDIKYFILYNNIRSPKMGSNWIQIRIRANEEKYSSGRRGAPAKGVDRATGARVQIPPSPFKKIQI